MAGKDWIPRSDEDFEEFFKKYVVTVKTNTAGATPLWTHIPDERVNELTNSYGAWHIAYEKLKGAHTSGDVIAKNEARDDGEDVLRAFNREYILNSREVTNAQREDIGCPVHDTTHTPVPQPKAEPEADIVYPGKHLLELARIRAIVGTLSDEEEKAEFGVRIFWGSPRRRTSSASAPRPRRGTTCPTPLLRTGNGSASTLRGTAGRRCISVFATKTRRAAKRGKVPSGPY